MNFGDRVSHVLLHIASQYMYMYFKSTIFIDNLLNG